MEWDEVIGKRANRDYEEDELIERLTIKSQALK